MENQNPEKIPLNPIVTATDEKKKLYETTQVTAADVEQRQALSDIYSHKPTHTTLPLKHNLLLIGMVLIVVILAVGIGMVLFKDGFGNY